MGSEPVTPRYWRSNHPSYEASVSPEFFRLYAVAKIAFIALRIIASLDFIPAVPYVIHFIYRFVQWFIHHGNIWTHKWQASTICGFIAQLFWASQLRWSPEFLRLLYAIAKIAFITVRIVALLNKEHMVFLSKPLEEWLHSYMLLMQRGYIYFLCWVSF